MLVNDKRKINKSWNISEKKKCYLSVFLFKNNNKSAFSGVNLERLSEVKWPAAENILSDGALVPAMHKYLNANWDKITYLLLWLCHHSRGFSLRYISRSPSYMNNSGSRMLEDIRVWFVTIISKRSKSFFCDCSCSSCRGMGGETTVFSSSKAW